MRSDRKISESKNKCQAETLYESRLSLCCRGMENLFFSQENQNLGIMNKKPLNERKIWLFKYRGIHMQI